MILEDRRSFKTRELLLFIILSTFFIVSCTKDSNSSISNCNQSEVPIVAVHGYLASGDTYDKLFARFRANGYCAQNLYVFDWNTVGLDNNRLALKNFVEDVIESTGSEKVYLIGHSLGTRLCYETLLATSLSDIVKGYVHIAGFKYNRPAGKGGAIPTLNIWSESDYIVPGNDMPGATNVVFSDLDHFEVATNTNSFKEIYKFFLGKEPSVEEPLQKEGGVIISGKAVSFVENIPMKGALIKIYEVNESNGLRIGDAIYQLKAREAGFWGPVELSASSHYEFLVYTGKSGDRPIHYYRESLEYDNELIYLRTFPPKVSLGSLIVSEIPGKDDQGVSIYFNTSQSVVNGRDVLKIDNKIVSTPVLTPIERDIIALFLYDGNRNDSSDIKGLNFLGGQTVVDAVDFYFPTISQQTIKYELNGRTLNVKNWPSKSDGISVAIFN